MNNNQYKLAAILLGIALLFSLGACYHYYQQAQTYNINQEEFAEYQKLCQRPFRGYGGSQRHPGGFSQ